MMLHDVWLTDPDVGAVLDAIQRAFDLVYAYSPTSRVATTNTAMRKLANRTVAEPEGVDFWTSKEYIGIHSVAGQILVAWWTAAFGRRHVHVTGRMVDHLRAYKVNTVRMTTRPPL